MDNGFPLTWQGWKELVLAIVASSIATGGIYRLVNIWLHRKKPSAETAEITIRAKVTEGDAVARWMDRLEVAQTNIDRLRHERDKWQDQYDIVFVQRDELLKENGLLRTENKAYATQIEKMYATLKTHDLNYDDTKRS
jgi:FtsZ-binding cell division protein ZapB